MSLSMSHLLRPAQPRARRPRFRLISSALVALWIAIALPGKALAQPDESISSGRPTLTGRPVIRDAFHFQVAFGLGGGPDSAGIFHAMEIGGTFPNGMSLNLLHTFIQNKGIFADHGGPDLFGGWMPQFKFPIYYDDLIGKVAFGPGGIHRQDNGIEADFFLGWSYGIDMHVPFFRRSGMTLGTQALHVYVNDQHHFGFATSLGYTFF